MQCMWLVPELRGIFLQYYPKIYVIRNCTMKMAHKEKDTTKAKLCLRQITSKALSSRRLVFQSEHKNDLYCHTECRSTTQLHLIQTTSFIDQHPLWAEYATLHLLMMNEPSSLQHQQRDSFVHFFPKHQLKNSFERLWPPTHTSPYSDWLYLLIETLTEMVIKVLTRWLRRV